MKLKRQIIWINVRKSTKNIDNWHVIQEEEEEEDEEKRREKKEKENEE